MTLFRLFKINDLFCVLSCKIKLSYILILKSSSHIFLFWLLYNSVQNNLKSWNNWNILALLFTSISKVFGWSDFTLFERAIGKGESSPFSLGWNKPSFTLHFVVLHESTHNTDTKWILGNFFSWVNVPWRPSLYTWNGMIYEMKWYIKWKDIWNGMIYEMEKIY